VTNQVSESPGFIGRLWREPLFHFLGLAILLFFANALLSGDDRETITVDAATQEYLIDRQQELMLRDLTEAEKSEVIENYIEEEILVLEARKRGFENSSRIRTLLIQNMRFFMASEIPEPTEEDLHRFFEENIESFEIPSTVTYDHVLFIDPNQVPADLLDHLNRGAEHVGLGDTNQMNSKIYRAGEQAVVSVFGRNLAPVILGLNDQRWHGPFDSNQGVHFLRVAERHPPAQPSWDQAENWIATEWLRVKNNEIVDREMAAMRDNYRVEIESATATPE
jgi:hypothetical protein